MIHPIVIYGHPILQQKCSLIDKGANLEELVSDMFETMYVAQGVGLAAPQICKNMRLFIVDTRPMEKNKDEGFVGTFINPQIKDETGNLWTFEEGCLSIPNIRENIQRKEKLVITYFDENWIEHEKEFAGIQARVIQHEYDHIEGKLFTDYLSQFKKRILKKKLQLLKNGIVDVNYKVLSARKNKCSI